MFLFSCTQQKHIRFHKKTKKQNKTKAYSFVPKKSGKTDNKKRKEERMKSIVMADNRLQGSSNAQLADALSTC